VQNVYGDLQDIAGDDDNESAYFEERRVGKSTDRKWLRNSEMCMPKASDLVPEFAEGEVRGMNRGVGERGEEGERVELKKRGMGMEVGESLGNWRHVKRGVGAV